MRNWLGKWTKRTAAQPGRDPLAAVPRVPPGVTATPSADGLLVVRNVAFRGGSGRVVKWLGGKPSVRVVLDERGAFFWGRIDGQHSLAVIRGELQTRFGLEDATARWCTIEFTKQLMRRNLLELKIADCGTTIETTR